MLDRVAEIVRRHDPDRFLTALFAPGQKRPHLFTLYAFNHELARAREAVSEAYLALIRLQWWREVAEGAKRAHEVAAPLAEALDSGALDRADLLAMIDAREIEAEPFIASLDAWREYLLNAAGGVMVAAGRLLGAPNPEALRPLGAAYGVGGVLRSVEALARQKRCLLPAAVLRAHDLTPERVIAEPSSEKVATVRLELAQEGRALLLQGDRIRLPGDAVAAALPAVLAGRDLERPTEPARPRGLMDRLAVIWAGITRRI
ncbi:MAG: squalene/phytoene synthase family protein [Acetobacteraceae bacterium]|nr:squalene/phytoene synthase family protein [Acetobacteraceae bacterium]